MRSFLKAMFSLTLSSMLFFSPLKAQAAFDYGSLLGAIFTSSLQSSQIMSFVNYYDTDGREELFAAYKDTYMAKDDPELNRLLSDVVERLSVTVAKNEISIIERPYNYFIVPSKQFNAACGLGHTMFVNEGVFTFVDNDPDMLAAVVAHEMVHGQQDHNIKGIKKQINTLFAQNIIGSQIDSYGGNVLLNIVSLHVVNTGITKPGEWEADNLSYAYLTDSGYNPGAPAAVWQKVSETAAMQPGRRNVLTSVLNPATHPKSTDRRDNFAKKLTEYSNGTVHVEEATGEIKINGQTFMTPADSKKMSARVRSYMIAGNLAALYHTGVLPGEAVAQGDGLLIDGKIIMQTSKEDAPASALAARFNQIK